MSCFVHADYTPFQNLDLIQKMILFDIHLQFLKTVIFLHKKKDSAHCIFDYKE